MRTRKHSAQTKDLLAALLDAPAAWHYGYELAKATGLRSGTLYPILIRLCAQGLLKAEWREAEQANRPPRHVYRLTGSGLTAAREATAGSRARKASLRPLRTTR